MTRSRIWLPLALTLILGVVGCGQKAANQPSDGTLDTTSLTSNADTSSSIFQAPSTTPSTDSASSSSQILVPTPSPTVPSPVPSVAPSAAPSAVPSDVPSGEATASPTPTPTASATPSPSPTPALDLAYALKAKVTDSKSSGFLWLKLTATVEVQNPSFLLRQSGKLVVTFSHNGLDTETKTLDVILDPADIRDYTIQSDHTADAARADVIDE